MSDEFKNLFTDETNDQASATSTRSLQGTAQLTTLSLSLASIIIKQMEDDVETYKERFLASRTDASIMDKLINEVVNLPEQDVEFLKTLEESTLESMLKSQQSKRSRLKSKAMTVDNYRNLMSGAIAELLLRQVMGKEKSAGGFGRQATTIEFTPEALEGLKNDQEKLRKEIRNVQSKKSIFKSKGEFSEDAPHWIELCNIEATLKGLRDTSATTVVKVDETKDALAEKLADVDLDHMKASDSKVLLASIRELLNK